MANTSKQASWPPPIVECQDLAKWQEYEDKLYKIYLRDLYRDPPQFFGKIVKTKYHPPYKGKAFSFWHLTHEGKIESERTPDLKRCERLCWIKPFIEQYTKLYFWIRPDKQNRHYIWSEEHQYLIVLQPKKDCFFLVTAYYVERKEKVREYTNEAIRYGDNNKAA